MSETAQAPAERDAPRPQSGGDAPPPPKRRGGSGGTPLDPDAWMVTFSDLLTLLMTFFVLIFASQDPVPAEKLQEAFGQTTGVFGLFRTGFLERIAAVTRRDLSQDLIQVFLDEIGAVDVEVEQQPGGLVISLPTDTYFAPGSERLNADARKRIDALAEFLAATRHGIRVEGHTDDRERAAAPYPSAWELSVARAHQVLVRLRAKDIAESRLSLVGYGPAKPRFDNATRSGRQHNRRVEIVILNRRGGQRQP